MHVESGSLNDISNECNDQRMDYAKQLIMFLRSKGILLSEVDVFQFFNMISWQIEIVQGIIDDLHPLFLIQNPQVQKPLRRKSSVAKENNENSKCVFCEEEPEFIITMDKNEPRVMSGLSCGHGVCQRCLGDLAKVKENKEILICNGHSCKGSAFFKKTEKENGLLSVEEIKTENGKVLIQRVEEITRKWKEKEESEHICIPQGDFCLCSTATCEKCKEQAHCGSSCDQNDMFENLLRSDLSTNKKRKDCPHCFKTTGQNPISNRTQCENCHFSFCWMCLNEWEAYQGYHYCPAFEADALIEPKDKSKEKDWPKKFSDYANLHFYHGKLSLVAWNRLKEFESNQPLSKPLQSITKEVSEDYRKHWICLWRGHQILANGFLLCAFIPQETTEKDNFERLIKMRTMIEPLQHHMLKLVRASDEPFTLKSVGSTIEQTKNDVLEIKHKFAQYYFDVGLFQKYSELKKQPDFNALIGNDPGFNIIEAQVPEQCHFLEERIKEEDLKWVYYCHQCQEISVTLKHYCPICPRAYMFKRWQCPKCTVLNEEYRDECSGCGTGIALEQCPLCTMFIPRGYKECPECAKNVIQPTDWKCVCGSFNQIILLKCKFCTFPIPEEYRKNWRCENCKYENFFERSECYRCYSKRKPLDHDSIHMNLRNRQQQPASKQDIIPVGDYNNNDNNITQSDDQKPYAKEIWKCSKCNGDNELNTQMCRICNETKTFSMNNAPKPTSHVKAFWKCQKCKGDNELQSLRCHFCYETKAYSMESRSQMIDNEHDEPEASGPWVCNKCHGMNFENMKICEQCKWKFISEWKCRDCGHKNQATSLQCFYGHDP